MRSDTPTHEQCWDDIPWLVNGAASEADQKLVLEHAADCAECREELARQRRVYAHLRTLDDVEAPPEAAWQRLLAHIDEQSPPATTGMSQPPRQRRWLAAAVWVQSVVIVGLIAARFTAPSADYVTLATPDAVVRGATVRVVFAPDVPIAGVQRVLQEIGGEIIAGPSEAGVLTVAIEDERTQVAVAALRRHTEVVFAEPGASNDPRLR